MEIFGIPSQAFFGQLLLGLINGSFYAILSLGLAIIFGLLNIINFAHGAQYMVGAFVAWMALTWLGIGYWWALLLSPLAVGAVAVLIERTMLRHLYKLLIPVFILGVPLIDAVWAFVRRTASGQGFHTPDKNHIHHRLMRLGHGHRRTVIILWLWTALLCGFVLFPLFVSSVNVFIPLGVAILLIALLTWFNPLVNRWVLHRGQRDPADESAMR